METNTGKTKREEKNKYKEIHKWNEDTTLHEMLSILIISAYEILRF